MGYSKLNWGDFGGLQPTVVAGLANHPGILNKSTLSISDGGVKSGFAARTSAILDIANTTTEVIWIVRLNTISTNTNVNYRFGMTDDPTNATPANGIYVEKLAADVGLFGVSRAAATQTRTATALITTGAVTTWAAGDWMKVRIRRVNATTIGFSLNGMTQQTMTTNIPTVALQAFLQIGNNSTANAFTIDIDYFHLVQTGFTR